MNQLLNNIRLRISESIALCKIAFAYIISVFIREKQIWLISERGTDARDNGYWLYKYILRNHPQINVYYIISEDSPDREKVERESFRIINYKSLKHIIYLLKADRLISTHINGFSPWPDFTFIFRYNFFLGKKKTISLRHGIGIHYTPVLLKSLTNLNLITCGSKIELEYMSKNYGYSLKELKYTGLCRYDNLYNSYNKTENYILIMPTWRNYLSKENIKQSDYVSKFISLLNNQTLLSLIRNNGFKLIFYPHHEVQPYISIFNDSINDENIVIANKFEYDVQDLLIKSKILITDYSSVFFDFVYMDKPVIYYQFDENMFHTHHYAEGYFNYHNGLGPWTSNEEELIKIITKYISNKCCIESPYRERIDKFFEFKDSDNCKRAFDAIAQL